MFVAHTGQNYFHDDLHNRAEPHPNKTMPLLHLPNIGLKQHQLYVTWKCPTFMEKTLSSYVTFTDSPQDASGRGRCPRAGAWLEVDLRTSRTSRKRPRWFRPVWSAVGGSHHWWEDTRRPKKI